MFSYVPIAAALLVELPQLLSVGLKKTTLIKLFKDLSWAEDSTGMHGTWVPHMGATLRYWCAREEFSTTGVPVKRPSEATGPGTPTRPLPFVLSSQNIVELSH